MAAEPTRSSQRIADRLPTQDAPYLQKPFYTLVGAHLARQANTLTENQVKVFWGEALRLYFSQDDAFSADVEGYTEGLRRADLIIFFVGEYDESGLQIEKPWLVMEVKGATPTAPVGWHAEQESMQYAKELCETYGVNGIWCGAAEGAPTSLASLRRRTSQTGSDRPPRPVPQVCRRAARAAS